MSDARSPSFAPADSTGAGCGGACATAFPLPFTMAFQPIVDVRENSVIAHEALVRGPNGESAASILAAVTSETLYAFDQACRVQAITCAARIGLPGRLNINFLPKAIYEPRTCIQTTLTAAARTGFPVERLTFEMVETEETTPGHLARIVKTYREIGFHIALDDYGTGHSGLLRIAELRPDTIKVDRQLVTGVAEDSMLQAIARVILQLCHETGIEAVFEGVETEAEARCLVNLGARYMQGFLFARPTLERAVTAPEISWPVLHATQG